MNIKKTNKQKMALPNNVLTKEEYLITLKKTTKPVYPKVSLMKGKKKTSA